MLYGCFSMAVKYDYSGVCINYESLISMSYLTSFIYTLPLRPSREALRAAHYL